MINFIHFYMLYLIKNIVIVECFILKTMPTAESVCPHACFSGRVVSGECQGEMMDYRRMLMEDFSLSPEIVLHCRSEIEGHCSGLHRKGRTLHCLMRVGRGDMGAIDPNCQRAVRSTPTLSEGREPRIVICTMLYRLCLSEGCEDH